MLTFSQSINKTHKRKFLIFTHQLLRTLLFSLNLISLFSFAQSETNYVPNAQEVKTRKLSVEREYKKDLEDCYQKFLVNQCKDTAFSKLTSAMAELREYELKNNEIERLKQVEQLNKDAQMKLEERARDIQIQKDQANANYDERLRVNKEKNEQYDKKFKENPSSSIDEEPTKKDRTPMSSPAADARAKFEAKQRSAEAHKAQVLKRLAEKEKSKKTQSDNAPANAPAKASAPAPVIEPPPSPAPVPTTKQKPAYSPG